MIKKIVTLFLIILVNGTAYANIHIDGKIARKIILEYIDKEHQIPALQEYNRQLKSSGNYTMSGAGLYKVCIAAGWDVKKSDGKTKCDNFVKALIVKSDYKYYAICGKDKGKSGGKEYCVDDVFSDIEVQIAQAYNLAHEYAKIKYNDDIVCDLTTKKGPHKDDYVKCVSKLKNIYYEFKFDDALESNANDGQFVQREFGRGLCLIYGGKPESVVAKPVAVVLETKNIPAIKEVLGNFECKHDKCSALNMNLNKWRYKSYVDGRKCVVSYTGETNKPQLSNEYYAKFDGHTFSVYYKNKVIKSWKAVSGRGKSPDDPKPTICQLPIYQKCEDIGPIPQGIYYIYQNEIQYADNITVGNFNSNSFLADTNGIAWGTARIELHPDKNTNTYGRTSMYLHGGKYAGSAGCIDLTTKIGEFVKWFGVQSEFTEMKLIVDYGYVKELCDICEGETCKGCRCITDAKDCSYI